MPIACADYGLFRWVQWKHQSQEHGLKKFANFVYIVSDYGLFSQDDDPSKGKWLEPARTLNFYPLKNGVSG